MRPADHVASPGAESSVQAWCDASKQREATRQALRKQASMRSLVVESLVGTAEEIFNDERATAASTGASGVVGGGGGGVGGGDDGEVDDEDLDEEEKEQREIERGARPDLLVEDAAVATV